MTDDIFKYIDIERTINEFGYDPRELTKGSGCFVISLCKEGCGHYTKKRFNQAKTPRSCHNCLYYNLKENRLDSVENFSYVNVEETKEIYGYDPSGMHKNSPKKIVVNCKDCGKLIHKACQAFTLPTNQYRCKSCAGKGREFSEEARKKLSLSKLGEKNPMFGIFGENHHRFGKKATPEDIAKFKASMAPRWAAMRENAERNRDVKLEKIRIWRKNWVEKNREGYLKRKKEYRKNNKEKISEYKREIGRQAAMNRAIAIVTSNPIEE